MRFDFGSIIAIAAALFFYVRLIMIQRQKLKDLNVRQSKPGRKTTGSAAERVTGIVRNWLLVGVGVLFIGIGAVVSIAPGLSAEMRALWWIPLTLGIILMTLGIG